MKITVVGAILILAAVAAGVLLILALKQHTNGTGEEQSDGSRQNPPWPNEPGT